MSNGAPPKKSPRASKIPIRYRLRNPPPVFVGRDQERQALRAAIERGTVAVVWGMGGLGKTALVTEVLHKEFGHRADQTVMVGLRPDEPTALALDIVKALAEARGMRSPPVGELINDHDALTATAIDLADEGDLWLVLDDFHYADPDYGQELLRKASAYSRSARWIVTSRVDPGMPEIAEQVLALGAMPHDDLRLLASRCIPTLDSNAVSQLARSANGSPWQLRQSLTSTTPQLPSITNAGSQPPAPEAPELLSTLWLVEVAVPADALRSLGVLPDDETTRTLERHGYIESTPAGIRLHDVARAVLEHPRGPTPEQRGRLAEALTATDVPALTLAAARLHITAGDLQQAGALLAIHADRILYDDEAVRLWQLLEPLELPWARTLKLRCAVEVGGGPALAWAIHIPSPQGDPDRVLRLRALVAAGELQRAGVEAADLRGSSDACDDTQFEAGLILAHCAIIRADANTALDTLDALSPVDGPRSKAMDARRNVLRARALVLLTRFGEALAIAEALRRELDTLEADAQRDINEQLVVVYRNLGHLRAAKEANLASGRRGVSVAPVRSQRSLVRLAGDHLEQGELQAGRDLLVRLWPYVESAPHLRPLYWMNQLRYQMSYGEYATVEARLDDLLRDAERTHNVEFYQWAMIGVLYNAIERAKPANELPYSAEMPLPSGPQDPYIAVYFRMLILRTRADLPSEGVTGELKVRALSRKVPTDYPDLVDVRSMANQCQAIEAAFARDESLCLRSAARGVELAEEHGWLMFGADARRLQCQLLVALARFDEARIKVAAFRTATERFGSPRFDCEHAILDALVREGGPHPAELEKLNAAADVSPTAARIARGLLDASAHVDRVEALMIGTVRKHLSGPEVQTVTGGGSTVAGWGIDELTQCVWLPDGSSRDLSAHQTSLRVLAAIARNGGTIEKEALARSVWDVTDYHPLNDDGRIHVAIRRLRQQIEPDSSSPTRLTTTAGGYGFGRNEPVRFRPASDPLTN